MKQNYKKLILPALAVAIFLPLVSMAASDITSKKSIQHRESSTENFIHSSVNKEDRILQRDSRRLENRARHTEMMEILEAGDYNAWVEFIGDKNCPMISEINEENFSDFVEMHREKVKNRNNEIGEKNQKNFRGGKK